MAMATKRPTAAKPAAGRPVKSAAASSARGAANVSDVVTKPPPAEAPPREPSGHQASADGPAHMPANPQPATVLSPAAGLADAQVRSLAELCAALDRKCLELLEDVAAARAAELAAQTASEPVIAKLNEALAEERGLRVARERELADLRRTHQRELADGRRAQSALEREIASLRLVMERSNRPALPMRDGGGEARRDSAAAPAPVNGEHAARLLPLLQTSLASGAIAAEHDTTRALARFRVAAMIDAIEGTPDAPVCLGWVLSRADLQADPVMFLMDDVGLLGWTAASAERPDVNGAHRNTRPRPGFRAPLSRVPVGRLRGIVAIAEADGAAAVFFEAARKAIPAGLLAQKRR